MIKNKLKAKLTILLNFSIVASGIVPSGMISLVPSRLKRKIKNINKGTSWTNKDINKQKWIHYMKYI